MSGTVKQPNRVQTPGQMMVTADLSSTGIGDFALITEEGMRRLHACRLERSQISVSALEEMHQNSIIQAKANYGQNEEDFLEYWYMLNLVGNVAVLSINGVLVNNDDKYNRFFGEVGYPEIQGALAEAVSKPQIDTILMLMDTPGGAVSGISDMTDTIKAIGKDYKIHAHAASSACSGGYWLSCAAKTITASSLAEIGSIGVIAVLQSVYRMYQEMGIDTKVLRQGKFKALGNRYEPLSKEAEKVTLDQMGVVYDTFLNVVADARGMTVPRLIDTAAEGRVFYGADALKVGLIDKISSFEEVLKSLLREDQSLSTSTGNTDMIKGKNGKPLKVLSARAQAAIQSGADPKLVSEDPEFQPTEEEIAAAEAAAAAEIAAEEAAAAEAKAAEEAAAAEAEAKAKAEAEANAGNSGILELSRELGATTVKLAQAEAKIAALEAAKTADDAAITALRGVVTTAVKRMQIGLGQSPIDNFDAVPSEALAGQYHSLCAQVEKRFPIGGVSSAVVDTDDNSNDNPAHGQSSVLVESAKNLTSFTSRKK